MKYGKYFVTATALLIAALPASASAGTSRDGSQVAGGDLGERRVVQAVDDQKLAILPKTHLDFLSKMPVTGHLPSTTQMNHLQLVLRQSDAQRIALESLTFQQHDPKSENFRHWLTPKQFGALYGVANSDISAVTGWLQAEGFKVNNVYPNGLLIDFSGTADQVERAFHTREFHYALGGADQVGNATDISVPAALKEVINGVLGLDDMHVKTQKSHGKVVQWNESKKAFLALATEDAKSAKGVSSGNAVPEPSQYNPIRALVPNDAVTMYGIRTIRNNGVVGTGVNIALVENADADLVGWANFVDVFNLSRYNGTLTQTNPQPPTGASNCADPIYASDAAVTASEWVAAIAPGANIQVASCSDQSGTSNSFHGVFIAASNLVNGDGRPDIIAANAAFGESSTDAMSKAAIDMMWAQADAEGISVFVATGDGGVNVNELYGPIDSTPTIDMNALATSSHVTAVGGTDLADVIDGTTSKYFASVPSSVGGSALSYVPEIAWNESCGNGVAAKSLGFNRVVGFCNALRRGDTGYYPGFLEPSAGSGGPSATVAKPVWQSQVFGAAKDSSRDVPDVALFAGSYGTSTTVLTCSADYPCTAGGGGEYYVVGGTAVSTAMFAGIQALMDQGLAARGVALDQGNAAPTLYALATSEYGGATGATPATLDICNADNGSAGTANCIFHNITRGSISTPCVAFLPGFPTSNCYFYYAETNYGHTNEYGLTTADSNPTHYGVDNKAYGAQPGWSFATGLGSVNATNLLIAWRAYLHAVPASTSQTKF